MLLSFAEKTLDTLFAIIPRQQPTSRAINNTRIIAHRGAHDKQLAIIENTDKAFKNALTLGCWGIEFDVQTTADDHIVVNHDPTLKRLWGYNTAIRELTFKELRKRVPEVPLLSEVIEHYGQCMHLFIELKNPFFAEKQLVEALKELTPGKHYHLLSLDESLFASLKHIPRDAMLLVAQLNNTKEFCQLSIRKNYGGVTGHYLLLNDDLTAQLRSAHQHVGVGFIDSRFSLFREINRNINWVFTNQAKKICPLIKSLP